ncbi:MAG TPA: M48 family metalloprotease [Terracidiphilus sp.]|nr:M48 family metalloprotease [Terracidiphilus sp.]
MASAQGKTQNRAAATLLVYAILACAVTHAAAQTFPNPGKVAMSRDDQQALGTQAAALVNQQMPVLSDNSPEAHYIQQLGNKLAAAVPSQYAWPFDFHVVAKKDVDAIALPGGQIFLSLGTITSAANESVLAGLVAHEMAHVVMQHSAKHASRAQGAGNQAGAADVAGQLAQMGIHTLAQGMVVNYTHADELQADYVGTMILYTAGYNPQAMAVFFETLETQGGKAAAAYLSSHPSQVDRRQAIHNEMITWPAKNFSGDSPEFAQTRLHAMSVRAYSADEIAQGAQSGQGAQPSQPSAAPPPAPNQNTSPAPSQGNAPAPDQSNAPAPSQANNTAGPSPGNASVQNEGGGRRSRRGNGAGTPNQGGEPAAPVAADSSGAASGGPPLESIAPSQNMVQTDIGLMKLHRPDNWTVKMPQKQGQFVIVAPAAGMVGDNVGYGVLVGGFTAQQVQGMNIDQVTQSLMQQMEKTNGLTPMGDAKPATVSGHDGRSVIFHSSSPFNGEDGEPIPERDWLVTVQQTDGGVIFMVFVAPEANFNRLKLSYNAMLESAEIK